MTEEFLGIVDENNELTGESVLRSKVHAEGLWHRTVHVYIFRKNNDGLEFLVQLRSKSQKSYPNRWCVSFGGHVVAGASLEEAVRAELQEEIGLDVDFKKLTGGYWRKRDNDPDREFTMKYCLEYNGRLEDLSFNDGEVQEVKWMSVAEINHSSQKNPDKWAGKGVGFADAVAYLSKNA